MRHHIKGILHVHFQSCKVLFHPVLFHTCPWAPPAFLEGGGGGGGQDRVKGCNLTAKYNYGWGGGGGGGGGCLLLADSASGGLTFIRSERGRL